MEMAPVQLDHDARQAPEAARETRVTGQRSHDHLVTRCTPPKTETGALLIGCLLSLRLGIWTGIGDVHKTRRIDAAGSN